MQFNYTKWSFVIGTAIALGGVAASVAVPEVRCAIGLEKCTVQNELVDFRVRGENSKFLPGVKVYLASKGAPEVVETDSNGYAQIKIPSRDDVKIDLHKEGYQPQSVTVNLKNNRENTRDVTLKKLGSSTIPSIPTDDTPHDLFVKVIEDDGFKIAFQGCYRNEKVNCNFMITNLKSENRRFKLSTRGSRTIDSFGNEYAARKVRVARYTSSRYAYSALIQGIPIKAGIDFDLPAQLNSLAVVEMIHSGGNLQFRDVKINGSQASKSK